MIVITAEQMLLMATPKKAMYVAAMLNRKPGLPLTVLERSKDDAANEGRYNQILDRIASSKEGKRLGVILKDRSDGKNVSAWNACRVSRNLTDVDFSHIVAAVLGPKDEAELQYSGIASSISSNAMKNYLLRQITTYIDEHKKISHSKLSNMMDDVLLDQDKALRYKLITGDTNHSSVDWCYPPVIQSGGKYDLRPSASSNDDLLKEGVIVACLGARFKSYCANVARTFLMNPDERQEKDYKFLLDLQKHVLSTLKAGVLLSDVYSVASSFVNSHRPDLAPHLIKNLGFVMGIEFRDSQHLLSLKMQRPLLAGMVLNLAIGFEKVPMSDSKDVYAIFLADTVRIKEDSCQVLTDVDKDLGSISYTFGDDEDEEELSDNGGRRGAILATKRRSALQQVDAEELQKRKEHQKKLANERQEAGLAKYSGKGDRTESEKKAVFKKFESYRKEAQLPDYVGDLRIHLDRKAESIILPIFGQAVPFHLSTLKNVSKSDEQDFVLLRFNFITPGVATGKKEPHAFENTSAKFIRTISFRSNDTGRLNELCREINDFKKETQKQEAERVEMAGLVEQGELNEVKGRRPHRLPDVSVRPAPEGKRIPGDLEIHLNGLRYQLHGRSDQKIDVLFSNIKHLFFQPCKGELIVLLHVHLKHAIMIGKKKTKDVQFFREVTDMSFDETGNRRRRMNYGDQDELAMEKEERRKRHLLDREFLAFAEKISETSKRTVDADVPNRELAFPGVPFRQLVSMQPTTNCLVHLTDTPFFVASIEDVEVAHLERIQFGLKNFDMVLVYKDFKKPVSHINTIPIEQLETVKSWLDASEIPFSEGPVNLSWPQIMKTVNDNPKLFFEDGGWSCLQPDSDDEGESEEESEFAGSDAGSVAPGASESESSGSDFDSDASASGDGSGSAGGSDDESGEDWDELEAKAARHDKKRSERDLDGEEQQRPLKKTQLKR